MARERPGSMYALLHCTVTLDKQEFVIFCAVGVFSGHVTEENHAPQPYKFGYESQDEWGNAQSRHEEDLGDGTKRGSFGYRDAHGMYRLVNYIADHDGFRAWVKTNEPGTSDSAPAAARIEKTGEAEVRVAPILSANKQLQVAPVAASPVASIVPAPAPLLLKRPRLSADVVYGTASERIVVSPRISAPIVTVPRARSLAHPVDAYPEFGLKLAHSAPLAYAASRVAQPIIKPVPVRKVIGPSAAAFVSSPAIVPSGIIGSPRLRAYHAPPIVTGGLHAASSEAIVVSPAIELPVHRPYEKFAETFRRRRPIKTIGEKEIFVPPSTFTVGGIPVYKDK
ncbi:uncharacterized protein LOC108864167 [Galendromus occidentalis]|uniref:Uncharacterized protein LOC108864167 n=1 Tax=Galendromus occidentalis TaxID=34638 RepID=A0AAJ7L5R5_9ACAR|nr:uncharacterized protein LOC108864167 [Galendromus occidentalis]